MRKIFRNEKTNLLIGRLLVFSKSVIDLCTSIDFKTGLKPVCDQLIRSSGSIGANVVEAQAGVSTKDYVNFLSVSLKSANETLYWLLLLEMTHSEKSSDIEALLLEVENIRNILGKSIVTLKKRVQ
jgi:four helix bundle protein